MTSGAALDEAYEKAWREFEDSGEADAWERAVGDGLDDTPISNQSG